MARMRQLPTSVSPLRHFGVPSVASTCTPRTRIEPCASPGLLRFLVVLLGGTFHVNLWLSLSVLFYLPSSAVPCLGRFLRVSRIEACASALDDSRCPAAESSSMQMQTLYTVGFGGMETHPEFGGLRG